MGEGKMVKMGLWYSKGVVWGGGGGGSTLKHEGLKLPTHVTIILESICTSTSIDISLFSRRGLSKWGHMLG